MACARDTNVQLSPEYANYLNNYLSNSSKNHNCIKYKSFYPSFAPTINSLSVTSSVVGVYSNVIINGSNFLPPCYGTTYVNFGSYQNIPVSYFSSFNISFVVPLNATKGTHNVVVVNVYNSNFSPSVNQSYPGIPKYSNSVAYKIT